MKIFARSGGDIRHYYARPSDIEIPVTKSPMNKTSREEPVRGKAPGFFLLKGAEWRNLSKRSRERVVEDAFRYWRATGFPYYRLSRVELRQDFTRVLKHDWERVCREGKLISSNGGLRLANAYQPAMWRVRVSRYLSPMDVFRDDDLLKAAIRRAFKIWPTRYPANASSLRRMLKTFPSAASVSNYRPAIARAVISRFSRPGARVVDFCAGYGGRLLGALAADRFYLGIEPNGHQIRGFERMQRAIVKEGFRLPGTKFVQGAAEQHLADLPAGFADLVYSSPPFFNWEKYSGGALQSFKRYPTYDLWQAKFLNPVIKYSFRVLRKGGFMAINVTNGNRRPSPSEIRSIAESCRFTELATYPVVFPNVPYLHPRDGKSVKHELLMIFEK